MSKIPCRKCPDCGLINDITAEECVCGEDISYIPQKLYETDELPPDKRGSFDETQEFYSQKCPACGAVNYTGDKKSPVKRCFSCAKAKISSVEPTLFKERTPKPELPEKEEPKAVISEPAKAQEEPKAVTSEPAKAQEEPKAVISEPAKAQEEPKAVISEPAKAQEKPKAVISEPVWTQSVPMSPIDELFAIDDESMSPVDQLFAIDEAVMPAKEEPVSASVSPAPAVDPGRQEWSFRLSDMEEFEKESKGERDIVLTAVRYGVYSFTVTADMVKEKPFMLGRSAGEYEFLSKDPRVSGFHCTLFMNDGQWYIQDNNSTNGTFVDDTDLGDGGCTDLQEGDMIKLGHSADSMEFRVSFK